ncbi:hypothetical protein TI39_contig4427g00001 [Zymoseptoria brevis]|uniref:SET domain-containing protein n=1 Tax=Zymoseptoria brevis TaxID=1047168 RepID=A0A0F4GA29_9PEZI|nr:hypothetical protein TI39_contig4427g00001 [Zymoseptoria brevis]
MPLGCGSDLGGIFIESSHFNYSYSANASYSWNADVKEERVYAIRKIAAGEEITVCYLADEDWALSRKKRMVEIQDIHGFECSCARCGEGNVEKQAASDSQRQRFVEIERFLNGDWLRAHTPGIALKLCREALGILREEEPAVAMIESIYLEAFRICASHGDMPRASVFASLAADERRKWKGHDSVGVQEYKAWETKPQSHPSANRTTQWSAPGNAELPPPSPYTEEWLWRRAG